MASKYETVIYWSEDVNAFVVETPKLPDCIADDQTYLEALANAEIVIEEWLETAQRLGRNIPTPRGRLMFA